MTTPSFPPFEIADTLTASAGYLIADVPHILAQGRFEQPNVFDDLSRDALIHFVGRVRESWFHGPPPEPSERDVAIATQILRQLANWSATRQMAAAAWELALSPFLIDLPAVVRRSA